MRPEHFVNSMAVVVSSSAHLYESFSHGVAVRHGFIEDGLIELLLFRLILMLYPFGDGLGTSVELRFVLGVHFVILPDSFLFAFLLFHDVTVVMLSTP